MEGFINALAANPYGAIVIFLSIAAAIAFLFYAWGFTGYIVAHGHDEHLDHARVHMIWGVAWLIVLFVAWQIIRWVVNALGF